MRNHRTVCVFILGVSLSAPIAAAQDVVLELKPTRCIALHAGQTCYQTIVFSWDLPAQHNYCLVEESVEKPLHCWLGGGRGRFRHPFASDKNAVYQVLREDGRIIAEQTMEVSWVYRNKRKSSSGWRLF